MPDFQQYMQSSRLRIFSTFFKIYTSNIPECLILRLFFFIIEIFRAILASMNKNIHTKPIGYLLERTTRVVKLVFHKCFKELGIDITPEQWVVMDSLYQNNGQSQKDLASDSFKDAPTISRIINVLEKKDWVTRTPSEEDRRFFIIHQTDEGRKIADILQSEISKIREQGWKNLSQEDYDVFTKIINQVFDNYS